MEARQLAGLNMDPVVCVQVGEQKKYTSVKESTNCPYWNEKPKVGPLLGHLLQMNLPTTRCSSDSDPSCRVYDHQFYHKWALLTDPHDISSGPKGYLKCDISVIGKGDAVKAKTSIKKHCYQPVWHEQVIFTEMFPPLCRRIKLQLRDGDGINDTVIGTHFLDLAKISNEGDKGNAGNCLDGYNKPASRGGDSDDEDAESHMRYCSLSNSNSTGGSGKTKLDKERQRLCQREIEHVGVMARTMKALTTKTNLREKLKATTGLLQKLKHLAEELPGKKGVGPTGWSMQGKLTLYLWLGLAKNKKEYLAGLPKGYEDTMELKNSMRPTGIPPILISYPEKVTFQLRAHMYQGRSLIGSDASGLSDPFCRVVFTTKSHSTQVIDETLSPTWDEMLVFDDVVIHGSRDEIKADPLTVVIEIFDQDRVGKAEFIGRALAKPHVKMSEEPYVRPNFPPSLDWYDIYRGSERAGELLAAFELLQLGGEKESGVPDVPAPVADESSDRGPIIPVPKGIRPVLSKHRIEILFWGLRDLKRVQFMSVESPRVDIECAGHVLQSALISDLKKNPNFPVPVKYMDVDLPDNELYCPPLTIRVVDCRSFGRYILVGTHVINSMHKFMYIPTTKTTKQAIKKMFGKDVDQQQTLSTPADGFAITIDNEDKAPLLPRPRPGDDSAIVTINTAMHIARIATSLQPDNKAVKQEANLKRRRKSSILDDDMNTEALDWWSKYFASLEELIECGKASPEEAPPVDPLDVDQAKSGVKLPPGIHSRSKEEDDKNGAVVRGKEAKKMEKALKKEWQMRRCGETKKHGFKSAANVIRLAKNLSPKGSLKVYRIPLPPDIDDHTIMGGDPQYGMFQGLPSNDPVKVMVRVYVVKATDLHPADINGKADPYIVIQLGRTKISDKENYISKQLNPVFGKCFDIEATFPMESSLTVQIYDWDLVGSDDLIGQTTIDLENRFYSRHRATCGLGKTYETSGYNMWRDPMKPVQILGKLCKEGKLDGPHFQRDRVRIANRIFTIEQTEQQHEDEEFSKKDMEEHLALAALHHWEEIPKVGCKLVPEHVETRALYNPDKIGIEQGKLEMWVEMFPMDMPSPGPAVEIAPRKPKSYELRVIIWNTDEVVLEDDAFFSGEKMSDIYVKGWIKGPEDTQSTDIHYRSLTGEGNFNWRFVFPFDYLVAEEKIVISRKESLFSWDETETKVPARMHMQVWDADHFSADDFLGAFTMDLNRFPRGAKSAKLCTLNMLKTDGSVPMMSIFKQRRVKGWWPFYIKKENDELELTGKVEAEMHLLTEEEAEKSPAGLGRNEPEPLDKPNRPDSSFIWFLNPLKSIRYILWHNYRWMIIKVILVLLLAVLLGLFFYSMPGYTVKKIMGA
ncbi:PREDICTED: otoferlin-like [Priapulus caudatus]|uniref:Otoferlin-like n=1 Tax=Priapulus caudatus TaxID=37621 RepID=A0ABM1ECQ8_PRICU|nr:PREDICTED: otoferlin-like [Priapulus caudatus]